MNTADVKSKDKNISFLQRDLTLTDGDSGAYISRNICIHIFLHTYRNICISINVICMDAYIDVKIANVECHTAY